MDKWVKDWLAKQREHGEKGLEIKKFSNQAVSKQL
jgi:hypothetical protein